MLDGSRILGLDLGEKRIGVAVSDPTGFLATALTVLPSRGRAKDVAEVARVAEEEGVRLVVLGLPLSLSGAEGPQAEKSRRFGAALTAATGLDVRYWDERLTTTEAARYLRESGMRRDKRAANLDAAAAAIILQNYLDAERARR